MKKIICILLASLSVSACSTLSGIFPETRDVYQRAEAMPNLEIPPDLTAGAINTSMAIPGEGAVVSQTDGVVRPAQALAQIQIINNNKSLLSIPDEFTVAWPQVEKTLLSATGLVIDAKDQNKGAFNVSYTDESADSGWFSFMLFGNKDSYVITLTGVGNKTELVVLDEDGEWVQTEESDRLLSSIMTQYNISKSQQ